MERERESSTSLDSQMLLDSLLQNLYDFGKCPASETTWEKGLNENLLCFSYWQATSVPRLI